MWQHYTWLAGVLLSPLLLGALTPWGQAVVGCLFGAGALILANKWGAYNRPLLSPLLRWLVVGVILLPLIPLPATITAWLSPERAALANSFPIEMDAHPSWLTLAISPAGLVQRVWELCLVFTAFSLARLGAQNPGFPRALAHFILAAVLLLTASDLWLRLSGGKALLGIWPNRWEYAAGTFPNRNHFANWIFVACLFSLGMFYRYYRPFHAAREHHLPHEERSVSAGWFVLLILGGGLAAAIATGSRAGFAAWLSGLAVWLGLLAKRSRSRSRWISMLTVLLVFAGIGFLMSNLLVERLARSNDFAFKAGIWMQSLKIALKFPVSGLGMGGFAAAFNHYKTHTGDKTFWHAENEFVELVVETGFLGSLLIGLVLYLAARSIIRMAWRGKTSEPELYFGAVAALAAFAVHACFEFVFRIPANAILAGTLAGLAVGLREQPQQPEVIGPVTRRRFLLNLGWGAFLLLMAILQGAGAWQLAMASSAPSPNEKSAGIRNAMTLQPWVSGNYIALARAEADILATMNRQQQIARLPEIRRHLNAGLEWNPLDWELRLERAWLDLAFSTNLVQARHEAWETVRLNPLNAQIPLRFARHFIRRDPVTGAAFLKAAIQTDPSLLRTALEMAWQAERDPRLLWSLTPDTPEALLTLSDFAAQAGLADMAAQALAPLAGRINEVELAHKFLSLGRLEQALACLPKQLASSEARLLQIEIYIKLKKYQDAIHIAELVFRGSPFGRRMITPFSNATDNPAENLQAAESLRKLLRQGPLTLETARPLAEQIFALPPKQRDLSLLNELADRFPAEHRFLWMIFQTQSELEQTAAAADTALKLARRVTSL